MTVIKVDKRNSHFIIEIAGHANYAEHGKDIVCAGVSLLSFMLHRTINNGAKVITDIMEDGYCYFAFASEKETVNASIKTIVSGFQMLSDAYPSYVSFSLTSDEDIYKDTSDRR